MSVSAVRSGEPEVQLDQLLASRGISGRHTTVTDNTTQQHIIFKVSTMHWLVSHSGLLPRDQSLEGRAGLAGFTEAAAAKQLLLLYSCRS